MELTGTIKKVLPQQSGKSAKGEWILQPYLMETDGQYPKQVYFEVFGADRVTANPACVGNHVTIGVDVESREYNGKYYTTLRAWKIDIEK